MYQANYIHIRVTFNGAVLLCSFRQIPTCFNLLRHFWKQLIRGILKNTWNFTKKTCKDLTLQKQPFTDVSKITFFKNLGKS